MAQPTIDDVKGYLKIDFTDDDSLINTLIYASQDFVETLLNRPIDPETMDTTNTWTVPSTIGVAQMMLVAHWYENRSLIGKADGEIAFSVSALLNPHKLYYFGATT
jgi:uncharacterized phage protein (predicted DNA packaging)